ncbi:MAG: lipoyl(octanoyl) transferase LipB [Candidatus Bipolaricaulaceae bacterium]
MRRCLLLRLGRVPYGPVLRLQRSLHGERRAQNIPNVLLSLEHTPVITLGRAASPTDLLLPAKELRQNGVEVYEIERGGGATYHGPGQLVLYPVVDLRELGISLREYVRRLEEVMILAGRAFGVELFRQPGHPGAWHTLGKVGFIGVHVRGWITMHGLAFNVDLEPDGFRWIVPCGRPDLPVVSLRQILGKEISLAAVESYALRAFAEVFCVELVELSGEEVRAWLSRNGSG